MAGAKERHKIDLSKIDNWYRKTMKTREKQSSTSMYIRPNCTSYLLLIPPLILIAPGTFLFLSYTAFDLPVFLAAAYLMPSVVLPLAVPDPTPSSVPSRAPVAMQPYQTFVPFCFLLFFCIHL